MSETTKTHKGAAGLGKPTNTRKHTKGMQKTDSRTDEGGNPEYEEY